MDVVFDLILTASKWSRLHLHDISLALLGMALVVFGPNFNMHIRRSIGHFNSILRVLLFALLCLLSYALVLIYLTPQLVGALAHLNNYTLAPMLLAITLLLGFLIDRN